MGNIMLLFDKECFQHSSKRIVSISVLEKHPMEIYLTHVVK